MSVTERNECSAGPRQFSGGVGWRGSNHGWLETDEVHERSFEAAFAVTEARREARRVEDQRPFQGPNGSGLSLGLLGYVGTAFATIQPRRRRGRNPSVTFKRSKVATTLSALMPANAGIQSGPHDPLATVLGGNEKTEFHAVLKGAAHSRRRVEIVLSIRAPAL
jgi:hypothetical protein